MGALLGLALTGQGLNTMSLIGAVILIGIVVNDAIIKVDFINQARVRGSTLRDAILRAGEVRLRPIVMTTVTTIAALVPILISTGRGADVARAMALPIFGGMLIEPFTTFIVPTLYCAYLELKMRAGLPDKYWAGVVRQGDVAYSPSASATPAV